MRSFKTRASSPTAARSPRRKSLTTLLLLFVATNEAYGEGQPRFRQGGLLEITRGSVASSWGGPIATLGHGSVQPGLDEMRGLQQGTVTIVNDE